MINTSVLVWKNQNYEYFLTMEPVMTEKNCFKRFQFICSLIKYQGTAKLEPPIRIFKTDSLIFRNRQHPPAGLYQMSVHGKI